MKQIAMIAALAIAATPALAAGPEPTIEGVPCREIIKTWAMYHTAALACFNEDTMIVKGKEFQSQAAIECIAKSPQAITKRK
jgi:hypothetical protein